MKHNNKVVGQSHKYGRDSKDDTNHRFGPESAKIFGIT